MLLALGGLAPAARAAPSPLPPPELVAHAGGEINGRRYTNSYEALTESFYKGFAFFEIDLELTGDNQVVLLHDWDYIIKKLFRTRPGVRTLAEFKKLAMPDGLTSLTFAEFADWLAAHPGTYAIIDTKHATLQILKKINAEYPQLRPRLIPQIYWFSQYQPVRRAGFPRIILSLYASRYSNQAVLGFVKQNPLWAVTLPAERAQTGTLPTALQRAGVFVYAHLVDTPTERAALAERGVRGFYTAFLSPVPN